MNMYLDTRALNAIVKFSSEIGVHFLRRPTFFRLSSSCDLSPGFVLVSTLNAAWKLQILSIRRAAVRFLINLIWKPDEVSKRAGQIICKKISALSRTIAGRLSLNVVATFPVNYPARDTDAPAM